MLRSVLETSVFTRRADTLLRATERDALIDFLAGSPEGDVVVGLGGVRKVRWAPPGRGKSGAFRVIYYLPLPNQPVLAIFLYGKNEQADLTPDQRRAVLHMVRSWKEEG